MDFQMTQQIYSGSFMEMELSYILVNKAYFSPTEVSGTEEVLAWLTMDPTIHGSADVHMDFFGTLHINCTEKEIVLILINVR